MANPGPSLFGQRTVLDTLAVACALVIADSDGVDYRLFIQTHDSGRCRSRTHKAEQRCQMPSQLDRALAGSGRQSQPAHHVDAQRGAGDQFLAAEMPLRFTHGDDDGYGCDPRMHDGRFVDIVEIQGMRHRGVGLRGIGRRHFLLAADDAALFLAAPLLHKRANVRCARLIGAPQSDTQEIQNLFLGCFYNFGRKIFVLRINEVFGKQIGSIHS